MIQGTEYKSEDDRECIEYIKKDACSPYFVIWKPVFQRKPVRRLNVPAGDAAALPAAVFSAFRAIVRCRTRIVAVLRHIFMHRDSMRRNRITMRCRRLLTKIFTSHTTDRSPSLCHFPSRLFETMRQYGDCSHVEAAVAASCAAGRRWVIHGWNCIARHGIGCGFCGNAWQSMSRWRRRQVGKGCARRTGEIWHGGRGFARESHRMHRPCILSKNDRAMR